MSSRKKQWDPKKRKFKEHDLRVLMGSMYRAFDVKVNAEKISAVRPDEIRKLKAEPTQNSDTKGAVRDLRYDLEYYKEISDSEDSFVANVLAPVKFSAQFVLYMKRQRRATTDLQLLVFAKSLPYDEYNPGQEVAGKSVTVSTICEKLRTTMSVRIPESQANKLDYGKVYTFLNVQPVPLANRMKARASRDKKFEGTNLTGDLSRYDFLFADIDDVEFFKYSFEMQHYCEISADKSGLNQMLGATLILSGELLGVGGQTAVIKNPLTGFEEDFHIRTKLFGTKLLEKAHGLAGSHVRILCSVWYDSGAEYEGHPALPEIFGIEKIGGRKQAVREGIIGHVRIRKAVEKSKLEKMTDMLQDIVDSSDCLEFDRDSVAYVEKLATNDDIATEYLKVSKGIERVRMRDTSSQSPLLVPDDFLDESNLKPAAMVRKKYVAQTILNAIWQEDRGRKNVVVKFDCPSYENASGVKRYIRQHGIAEFDKKEMKLTKLGRNVGTLAATDIIDDALDDIEKEFERTGETNSALCLYDKKIQADFFKQGFPIRQIRPDIKTEGRSTFIPTKLIIKHLNKENDKFTPVFQGSKFFWIKKGADAEKIRKEITGLLKKKFEEMFSEKMYVKPYSLNPFDEFQNYADSTAMSEFAKCFEICKIVDATNDKSGNKCWHLSNKMRVMWLLSNNGGSLHEPKIISMAESLAFTVKDGNNMRPQERLDAIHSTLEELEKEGKISGSNGGLWKLESTALEF